MSDGLVIFSSPEFKGVVQDMRELLSQSHLAFLLGAGCSQEAGLPLMPDLTNEVLASDKLGENTKKLLNSICTFFKGADSATIEDYMSELVDHISIAERRKRRGAKQSKIGIGDEEHSADTLMNALEEIKQAIVQAILDKNVDISCHQQFVKVIHGSMQAGKATRVIDYFVLNYDTLIEDALGLEKVAYLDGFTGSATGWWDPAILHKKDVVGRVFKVHGSIDWCLLEGDSLPRRIRTGIKTDVEQRHVLIYPAATKYLETQRDPFAQLLHQMRSSLRPAENKEKVLAICGYSFSDSHIDLEIENALYQSEGRLTVAAFVSYDEPQGKLKEWIDDPRIASQIRVYTNKGFFHENTCVTSKEEMPWWKFDVLVRLLGGEK